MQRQHPVHGLHLDQILVRQTLATHKTHETTRAIAAMLDLVAIGVVDDVGKVNTRRAGRTHRQNLVGPDTQVAVTQKSVLRFAQAITGLGLIEHHKVVAGTLHFGKGDSHNGDYQRVAQSSETPPGRPSKC